MTSGASELVMVQPNDTLDSVIEKLRTSHAHDIQLLIVEQAPALLSAGAMSQLGEFAARNNLHVTVFSGDAPTLREAQSNNLDVVGIDGMVPSSPPVLPPLETQPVPYATRTFTPEELELPLDDDDADFLDDLDRMPDDRRDYSRLDETVEFDLDDFDEDIPASPPPRGSSRRPVDDFDEPYVPPRRRGFADGIEDVTPPRGSRGLREARRGRATPALERRTALAPTYRGRAPLDEDDEYMPRRQSGGILLPLLVGALLVAALAGFWVFTNRPVVYVWPPPSQVKETAFHNTVLPVVESASGNDGTVVAVPVNTAATATIQGRASQQLSPVGVARGSVQIINTLGNPIELPAGTQFVATKEGGQQVSFLLDSPATVPPAVTSVSLTGTSTQFGSIEVQISARSPGSASNVGENTITQLIVPGQPPIQSSQQVRMLNRPIQGGSEEQVYVVSEQDVRAVLGNGLTQLYQAGVNSLQNQQARSGFVLDPATVFPNPQALGDPVNYEQPQVSPAIGQPVDQANPVFTMTLKANFNGLAAPQNKPVSQQLQSAVPAYLYQQNNGKLCAANEQLGFNIAKYTWSGQQLAVDGAITCTPQGALADETLQQVKSAVVGQSYENAVASLNQLQQNGAIGSYQLPQNIATFPQFAFLVQVERAPADLSPPATSAPNGEATAVPEATTQSAPAETSPAAPAEAAPTAGATP